MSSPSPCNRDTRGPGAGRWLRTALTCLVTSALPSACALTLDYAIEDCTNGIDDDGDGRTDCEDPACGGCQERGGTCFDGLDNDGDGLVDTADPTCWGPLTNSSDRQAQLLRVTRCSTRRGMDPAVPVGASAAAWSLDRAVFEGGVTGPVGGASFSARLFEPLTGALLGTRVDATFVLESPGDFTLVLGPGESEPTGNFDEIVLDVDVTADGTSARLSRGSGAASPDGASWTGPLPVEVRVVLEITAGEIRSDLGPSGLDPQTTVLPRPPTERREPGVEGPALALRWSGRADTERAFALTSLRVARDDHHPCDSPVPQPALDGTMHEVLGVTSTATTLCVVGRTADDTLVSLKADPAPDTMDAQFGLPEWHEVESLPVRGRFAVPVTWPGSGSGRFVVVTKADPGPDTPFVAVASDDCVGWGPPQPLTVDPPPDATGAYLAPAAAVIRDAALRLTALYDRGGLQARASCTASSLTEPCELTFEEGGLSGSRISLLQPITTSVSLADDIVWVSGAPSDPAAGTERGSLSLLEKNGSGFGPIFFEGSTDPGTFDRYVRQGAFWFDPDVAYRNDAVNEAQQRWMIYTAAECRDCPMRVGTARLVFNVAD